MRLSLTFLFLLSSCSSPSLGVAFGQGASVGMREIAIASSDELWGNLVQRGSVGTWYGGTGNSAVYGAYQLGRLVSNGPLALSIYSGPALISSTDGLLGSYLEFASEAHADWGNRAGYLGVFYRHMSDAGLTMVNVGRDCVGIEVGL